MAVRSLRSTRHRDSFDRLLQHLESRLLLSTYAPSAIRTSYGFNATSLNGAGQTIALIEAYNDTHLVSDLNTFDTTYNINGGDASTFLTVKSFGTQTDAGWAMETSLDVQWAHTIAPAANILVVNAASASIADLMNAVDYARNYAGVSVVSMSWGASEFSSETAYDSYFTTPAGHTNVSFFASSGDNGAGTEWPAVSPNVVAVGGTSLTINTDGSYGSESSWSGSGGGISRYESRPSYQNSVNTNSKRSIPDVAYNADPNTGFMVYDSNYNRQSGWWSVGGTSAGAPQWAAMVALANQSRGTSTLTSSQVLNTLYSSAFAGNFHDVTTGSNGYSATTGYDLVTGLGSPKADGVIPGLAGTAVATSSSDYSTSPTSGGGGSNGPGRGKNHGIGVSVPGVPTHTDTLQPPAAPRVTLAADVAIAAVPAQVTIVTVSTVHVAAAEPASFLTFEPEISDIPAVNDASAVDATPAPTATSFTAEQDGPASPTAAPAAMPGDTAAPQPAGATPQGTIQPSPAAAPADPVTPTPAQESKGTSAQNVQAPVAAAEHSESRWAMLALVVPMMAWNAFANRDRRKNHPSKN